MNLQPVENIVSAHQSRQGSLTEILEDIQAIYGYLPEEALREVAGMTGKPLVDVYGVATFHHFTLEPRGQHVCSACVGTSCHLRGSEAVAEELERELGVSAGATTADRAFTLRRVVCLGACALGPVVVIDGHYFPRVTATGVRRILAHARHGLDQVSVAGDGRVFPIDASCPRCNHSLMDPTHLVDDRPSIRVTVSFGDQHGWLRLSCLHDSRTVDSEHEIPTGAVAHFFCPHCHADLRGAGRCATCQSEMVPMVVREGGVLQICSRRGCHGRVLDLREITCHARSETAA